MEAEEMVSTLRESANGNFTLTGKACGIIVNPELLKAAADIIEQLNDFQNSQCCLLLERLDESQRREQAAVEDIIISHDKGHCVVCKYHQSNGGTCRKQPNRPCFEWRGPRAGKGRDAHDGES